MDYLVFSHHSSKICRRLGLTSLTLMIFCAFRVCRLHVYLFNLSVMA